MCLASSHVYTSAHRVFHRSHVFQEYVLNTFFETLKSPLLFSVRCNEISLYIYKQAESCPALPGTLIMCMHFSKFFKELSCRKGALLLRIAVIFFELWIWDGFGHFPGTGEQTIWNARKSLSLRQYFLIDICPILVVCSDCELFRWDWFLPRIFIYIEKRWELKLSQFSRLSHKP